MAADLTTPATVLARHRGAAHLTVCDGRERIGLVLDTRRPDRGSPAAPSYAFDADDEFVGEYPDRRAAARAISTRHSGATEPGR